MSDDYPLGESDRELTRLGFQHEVWAAETSAIWDRASFAPGQKIADLGAGPGFASLALSRRVGPEGEVLALDASERALRLLADRAEVLGARNVMTRVADLESVQLEEGSLDGAFARWLFCFLRDPGSLARRLAAWLKPGGTVALLDYFHYESFALAPRVEVMPRVIAAVIASWRAGGGDLDVGGKLPGYLREAGLELLDVRPIVHCARPGTALLDWPASFFDGYLDVLVERRLLERNDADTFARILAERRNDDATFMLTPPVIAIVARKPAL